MPEFDTDTTNTSTKPMSQFEMALDQREKLVRQEFLITKLQKQLERIAQDTRESVTEEWKNKFVEVEKEITAKLTSQSFWTGFIVGLILTIIFWAIAGNFKG